MVQSSQNTDPSVAPNLPIGHASQLVTATFGLKRPAGHAMHDDAAAAPCHLAEGQATHALAPWTTEKYPAAQSAHTASAALVCAAGPKRPAAHGVPVHGGCPLLECVPAAHSIARNFAPNPPGFEAEQSGTQSLSAENVTSRELPLDTIFAGTVLPLNTPSCVAVLEPS
jgi:hypothetical protein